MRGSAESGMNISTRRSLGEAGVDGKTRENRLSGVDLLRERKTNDGLVMMLDEIKLEKEIGKNIGGPRKKGRT